ncbi:MAG: antibiotic biosynthesis monooxygenase [Planctomycetes bacterium]|nr:antibiotic biosynthesis monooxygenase [Planctomycetota bacterium]
MVTIGMNYEVLQGKEKLFEDVFAKVIDVMKVIPGHTKTFLYRDVFNAQRYLIVSDWSDRAAFDGFVRSERFRGIANWGKEQVLAGRPTHDYYER